MPDHMYQLRVSSGLVVDLACYANVDSRLGSAWQYDLIEASVDGIPVGYLKTAFVPADRAQIRYPNALHYAASVQTGAHRTIRKLLDDGLRPEMWNAHQLKAVVQSEDHYFDDDDVHEAWSRILARIEAKHMDGYQEFIQRYVDRPNVSFACVYDEYEDLRYHHGQQFEPECTGQTDDLLGSRQVYGASWQGKGIATVMYEAASMWMSERGLAGLMPSTTQIPQAENAWKRLSQKHGMVDGMLRGETVRQNLGRPNFDKMLPMPATQPHSARAIDL